MVDIIIIAVFLGISLIIGILNTKKGDKEGFLIANRRLGVFRSVMTLCGTFVGAMTFLVYTAFVYRFGISAIWIFVGYFLGFIIFIPFALYLKDYSKDKQYYTIVDFFKEKFGKGIALLVVAVIFLWYFGTLGAQFIGGGKVLKELSGLDYNVATIIICAVIIIYLIFGGFKSVVATDVFQFGVLGIILIIITFIIRKKVDVPLSHFNPFNAGPVNIIAFLLLGLATPFATQDYWQKVYAMKNKKVVKYSFIISGVLVFILSIFLTYIGLIARTYFQNIDPDIAILYSFTKLVPSVFRGIVGIAFFAAILSTSDTFLFLLALNFTNDFLGLKGEKFEHKVRYTRVAILVIGATALILALLFPNIVDIAIIFKSIGLIISPIVLYIWFKKENSLAIMLTIFIITPVIIILSIVGFIAGFLGPEMAFISMFGAAIVYGITYLFKRKKG